jgi:hypothetical protein
MNRSKPGSAGAVDVSAVSSPAFVLFVEACRVVVDGTTSGPPQVEDILCSTQNASFEVGRSDMSCAKCSTVVMR